MGVGIIGTQHSYDFELARIIGIHEALLFQDIDYWCRENAANPKCHHDGFVWMFHSVSDFSIRYPELTQHQIRRALERLEKRGLIATGNYNVMKADRTKWYRPLVNMYDAKFLYAETPVNDI